ncbi:RICIN domain-containing protein, partial [Streptomyces sp. H10-C2]|uniref:RICIN domain-containing protein n=1 Tax=Streptomyces sp. H10-C2 TaxID=3046210 RepID=UPI0024BB95E5
MRAAYAIARLNSKTLYRGPGNGDAHRRASGPSEDSMTQEGALVVMNRHGMVSLMLAGALASAMTLVVGSPASASAPPSYQIPNAATGLCLEPEQGSMDQGAAIVAATCDINYAGQRWAFVSLGGTRFQFRNQLNGLCLDARGGAANGTPIQQWTCNSISNEIWDSGHAPLPLPGPFGGNLPLVSRVSGSSSHCLDGNVPLS